MSDAAVEAVARAVAGCDGPLEVLGDGAFATALRARLGARPAAGERPAVLVETSGAPEAIAAALAAVADLGTVVLAGAPAAPAPAPAPLDLYADLHVRGLTIVGVPHPPGDGEDDR